MAERRILFVEDDETIRISIAQLLRDEGYVVETAVDGADALARLAREPLPHVIVLDMLMPHLGGPGFRERQMADPRIAGIPVVVCSASPAANREMISETFADCGLVTKPVDFERLLREVDLRTRAA